MVAIKGPCPRAPQQESLGRPAPLLHRRWREAALVAHPGDITVEVVLVQKQDSWFPPPAKKPQPRSPDINDPSHAAGRPAKVLPLQRDRHQLRHANTMAGVRAETTRNPMEFAALDLQDCGSRATRCAMAEIAVPLIGEWRVLKTASVDAV